MKHFTQLTFLLAILTLTLTTSCKKDDDKSSSISFAGESYSLDKGFLSNYGDNGNGSYDFDVLLTTDGINYSDIEGEFTGTGDGVYLDLNTSSANGLVSGTYTYSSDRDAFTFVDAFVFSDYNLDDFTVGQDFEVIGGEVTIEVDGSNYTIEFDLTLSDNSTSTGKYEGGLRAAD